LPKADIFLHERNPVVLRSLPLLRHGVVPRRDGFRLRLFPSYGQGNFHKASRFGRILFAEEGWAPEAPPTAPTAPTASVDMASVRGAIEKLKGASTTTPAKTTQPPPPTPKPTAQKVTPRPSAPPTGSAP
jgi:hypothetical protein